MNKTNRPYPAIVRQGSTFLCSCVIIALLGGCNAYYDFFYADPDKCFEIAKDKKPYDVIIVPGFPYTSDSTNGNMEERIRWAAYLFKNGYTRNVIFSGSAVHSPYVEAEVMRLLASQVEIPDEHIYTETKAEHTTENLYYSYRLAKKLGFNSIAFSTQPAQASFMKAYNRKWKLNIDMLPVVTSCFDISDYPFEPMDLSSAYITNFIPLRERENFIKSLRGTGGHRIKVERRKERRQMRRHQMPVAQ